MFRKIVQYLPRVMQIFEEMLPGKVGEFIFDIHKCQRFKSSEACPGIHQESFQKSFWVSLWPNNGFVCEWVQMTQYYNLKKYRHNAFIQNISSLLLSLSHTFCQKYEWNFKIAETWVHFCYHPGLILLPLCFQCSALITNHAPAHITLYW